MLSDQEAPVEGASGDGLARQSAFIIFTNILSPAVEARIDDAFADLATTCDVHVVGYFDSATNIPPRFHADDRFHVYVAAQLEALDYPAKVRPFHLMPGNCDVPILAFSREHPQYDSIWLFEDDVVFTGPLSALIGAFAASSTDLIASNVAVPEERWPHAELTRIPEGWPADLAPLRVFLPFFRISRRLLNEIDAFYRAGGSGHHEHVWPLVARARGLEIEDAGGRGDYVKPGNRDRFYTSTPSMRHLFPGSFRYRPAMRRPGRRRFYLWHPVKESGDAFGNWRWYPRLYARWLRWLLKSTMSPSTRL